MVSGDVWAMSGAMVVSGGVWCMSCGVRYMSGDV